LKETLVQAGLPAHEGGQAISTPNPVPADDGGSGLTDHWPAILAVLLIALAPLLALLARFRARPAAG
jgi:hypothetical protein